MSASTWISATDAQETMCVISHFRSVFPQDMSGPPVAYVFGAEEARLVAAAPELLATLKALLVAVTYAAPPVEFGTPDDPNPGFEARVPVDFVTEARAAIAKATGQEVTTSGDELAREGSALGMTPKGGPA